MVSHRMRETDSANQGSDAIQMDNTAFTERLPYFL